MLHKVGLAAEDAVPRIGLEGEDGGDVAKGLVRRGEPVGQATSIVHAGMRNR